MKIRYTIVANIEDPTDVPKYVDWLKNGHVQAIKAGGASVVEVSIMDSDGSGVTKVESSYVFPSREILEIYLDGPAKELRKEGLEKFGHIKRERRIGSIEFEI